jgi:hypothetical protein
VLLKGSHATWSYYRHVWKYFNLHQIWFQHTNTRFCGSCDADTTCVFLRIVADMGYLILEQRINIKFCAKLGKNASDTCAILRQVFLRGINSSKRARILKSQMKKMRIALFDIKGRHCSLSIHSTRPNSQPSLLCGNTEAVKWSCAYKRLHLLPEDWIIHHDDAPTYKEFLAQKKYISEME